MKRKAIELPRSGLLEPELGADTVQRTFFMPKVQGRVSSRLTFATGNNMTIELGSGILVKLGGSLQINS